METLKKILADIDTSRVEVTQKQVETEDLDYLE